MPFKHGRNTEVWLDGADLSTIFNKADSSVDVDIADTTTFKKAWKTGLAGSAVGVAELAGFYDPTIENVRQTVLAGPKVLTVSPAGALALGDLARLLSIDTNGYKESSPIGGAIAFNWNVKSTDPVGFAAILHTLGAETANSNGAAVNGNAATTNGAVAHIHATIRTSTLVLTAVIQDSADGSTGWATIGTFAAISATGAQRLTIAGTVRQYTRALWTVTGSGSITFGLAMARL